jgi:hypothetical protein
MKPNGLSLRQAFRSSASRLRATPPDIASHPKFRVTKNTDQVCFKLTELGPFSKRQNIPEMKLFVDVSLFHEHPTLTRGTTAQRPEFLAAGQLQPWLAHSFHIWAMCKS